MSRLGFLSFSDFVQQLIEDRSINHWLDQKIQKAIGQRRSTADAEPANSSPSTLLDAPYVEVCEVEKVVERKVYIDKPVDRIIEKSVVPAWAKDLEQYAQLIPIIRAQTQLSKLLLGEATSESAALLYWLTRSGQWSTLEQVWQMLAVQVQRQESAITPAEQQILAASVTLYNQSTSGGAAALQQPQVGQRYDYEQHTRVNHNEESVAQVLLAGLINAQGKLVHCALVQTH